MGGFVLLPQDEMALRKHLVRDRGLRWLAADVLTHGQPRLVPDTWLDIAHPLPEPVQVRTPSREPTTWLFWCEVMGPLRTEADAPEPVDAGDRVARKMLVDASTEWVHVIDYARSPLIRVLRTRKHASGALTPGLLQAQAARTSDQPPELLALHRGIERWLRARCTKVNAWDVCRVPTPVARPANARAFAVWLGPAAAEWVDRGGSVWPWNA